MFRLLRTLVVLAVLAALGVFATGTWFLQGAPALPEMTAPSPEDVRAARALYAQVQRAASDSAEAQEISLTDATLRSALRLGSRAVPGFRAEAWTRAGALDLAASVPVPWIGGTRWLNLRATVPPFDGRLALGQVTLGGRDLSPDLSLRLAQIGANLVLGNQNGDRIVKSATAMRISGETLTVALALDKGTTGDVVQGVFGALRDASLPAPKEIDRYYTRLRQAMDDGTLPDRGSFLPHILFTLEGALEDSTPESLPRAYTAAIFALTRACGAKEFAMIVGGLPDDRRRWRTGCGKLTLAGRVDTRLHFTTAAAIEAAGNRGVAVSMGEFKELNDSLRGGSRFDFTDIAANNSGIRMSQLFMGQPPEAWPGLIARIRTEADLLASFTGLPSPLADSHFKATYGDVDSAAYGQVMQTIEERINATALHATPPG
jgi:hypothetical protein